MPRRRARSYALYYLLLYQQAAGWVLPHLQELGDAVLGLLAAEARLLDAAEGRRCVRDESLQGRASRRQHQYRSALAGAPVLLDRLQNVVAWSALSLAAAWCSDVVSLINCQHPLKAWPHLVAANHAVVQGLRHAPRARQILRHVTRNSSARRQGGATELEQLCSAQGRAASRGSCDITRLKSGQGMCTAQLNYKPVHSAAADSEAMCSAGDDLGFNSSLHVLTLTIARQT